MGIRQRLEDEGGGGSLGVGRAAGALPRLLIGPVHVAAIERRRERLDDQVEQVLAADVPARRGAQHRHDLALGDARAEGAHHLRFVDRPFLEILVEELVVGLRGGLDELLAVLLRLAGQLGGHVLHADQVDHARERLLGADGNLQRDEPPLEPLGQRFERPEKVGALAVEPVDDDGTGQIVLGRELPHALGLHLHAGDRVHDDHGALDDAQPGARLGDEVAVSGHVDEVDPVVLVVAVRERDVEGDLPLDLVGVEVGGCRAVVDTAEPGHRTGREEQRLDQGGLAHAAVADEADVADPGDVQRHALPPDGRPLTEAHRPGIWPF